MITITNEQNAITLNTELLEQKAEKLLAFLGYEEFDLGIMLTDLETMHSYNKHYRHKDASTDVLSFPYYEHIKAGEKIIAHDEDEKNLGDIILCPDYIKQDLERWGKTFEERLDILLVHGLLHLLGYDHIEDKDYEVMKAEEEKLLKILQ